MIRAGPLLLVFFSGSEDGEGVKFKETGTGGDRRGQAGTGLSYTYPTPILHMIASLLERDVVL